jgi:hypothetical protein
VYRRLWRENFAAEVGSEPSEEFLRIKHRYEAASASLSQTRERVRLLKSRFPIPKSKRFKYDVTGSLEDAEDSD